MSKSKVSKAELVEAIDNINNAIGLEPPMKNIGKKATVDFMIEQLQYRQQDEDDCLVASDYCDKDKGGKTGNHVSLKTVETLQAAGIKNLPKEWSATEEPAPKKGKGKKKSKTHDVKVILPEVPEKGEPSEAPAEKPKKKGKDKPKKVGVIGSIIEIILKEKEISKDDMIEKLKEIFPDRQRKSMSNTISAQIGSRLKKEKGITTSYDRKTGMIKLEEA